MSQSNLSDDERAQKLAELFALVDQAIKDNQHLSFDRLQRFCVLCNSDLLPSFTSLVQAETGIQCIPTNTPYQAVELASNWIFKKPLDRLEDTISRAWTWAGSCTNDWYTEKKVAARSFALDLEQEILNAEVITGLPEPWFVHFAEQMIISHRSRGICGYGIFVDGGKFWSFCRYTRDHRGLCSWQ